MSLVGISTRVGVTSSTLDFLLRGTAKVGVASRVGVTTSSLQQFIDGRATAGVASVLGTTTSTAQELRNRLGREGAIGLIIGLCLPPHS